MSLTTWESVVHSLGGDLRDAEVIGEGSSGVVYRAVQASLDRTVAVKVFRQVVIGDSDRVLSEARAHARLSWHSNIASLYGQGVTEDGFPYLVMEYAGGGSLRDRVAVDGPMPPREWRAVAGQLSSALAAAHRAGVVHRDVKPSNVLFAADGSVRLADFGIARAVGVATGTIDSIEGSLGYVAPEILDGERPSAAGDVYSMALTLGYGLTGRPPIAEDLTLSQAVAAVSSGVPAAEARWPGLDGEPQRLL
ncbi:MAG: serine/threonine-protein kinase, partial [Microthrixaceae bacterium]